jgi:hypothetical protein
MDEWEQTLAESDVTLDRARTRAAIKDSLAAWPHLEVQIPTL